ncbi:MAG: FecR domain-containing protein [Flavitalea sp.]
MNDNNKWQTLLEKYLANLCTKEELDHFLRMVEENPETEAFSKTLNDYWHKTCDKGLREPLNAEAKFQELMQEAGTRVPPAIFPLSRKIINVKMMAAAAVIALLFLAAGYFFYHSRNLSKEMGGGPAMTAAITPDIAPGYSGAILTLSNGEKLVLDSAQNGSLTTQGNTQVVKYNGQLTYKNETSGETKILYNTMSTPRGRQYQLVLSDGTQVWLNAGSSITYPTAFSGKERRVTMTGEAYFEVAKNAGMPFKVIAKNAEVSVLGTHFNINAYADEPIMQTTLIEGSVKVSKGKESDLLTPGQQAQLSEVGRIQIVREADVELALAWKNGFTSFKSADIKTIMRQVERWYDVSVNYEGSTPERTFTGDISRNANLSQLLRLLEVSKIHFNINGNKLTVLP